MQGVVLDVQVDHLERDWILREASLTHYFPVQGPDGSNVALFLRLQPWGLQKLRSAHAFPPASRTAIEGIVDEDLPPPVAAEMAARGVKAKPGARVLRGFTRPVRDLQFGGLMALLGALLFSALWAISLIHRALLRRAVRRLPQP